MWFDSWPDLYRMVVIGAAAYVVGAGKMRVGAIGAGSALRESGRAG